MTSSRVMILSVCVLSMLVSFIMTSPLIDSAKSSNTVAANDESSAMASERRYEDLLNELVEAENGLLTEDEDESDGEQVYMSKKSAPRRIFIGKRNYNRNYDEFLNDYESGDNKRALYLSRLNKYLNGGKRNGQQQIHRIFIGKRGDIKRIFIG